MHDHVILEHGLKDKIIILFNTKTKFSDNLTSPLSGFVMHKTADSNFPLTLNFGTFCF